MRKINYSGLAIVSMFFAMLIFAPRLVQGQVDATELKKFKGSWKMVSAEMNGKKVKDEHVRKSVMVFTDDKIKLYIPHHYNDTLTLMITKFEISKDPHVMYWVRESGPNAGKIMPAIYKFDGPDDFNVCFDPTMTSIPDKFDTDAGSGQIWHTWKRVK